MIGQTLFALFAHFSHFFARSDNRLLCPAGSFDEHAPGKPLV
jgi:hypothetical protein